MDFRKLIGCPCSIALALIIGANSSLGASGQSRTLKKDSVAWSFVFMWDGNKIAFKIAADAATDACNRMKPWKKLTSAELLDLYELTPPTRPGQKGVAKINYPKIIGEEQAALSVVAQSLEAISSGKDPRSLVNCALNFVQSIPYSTIFASGADFQTPIGVLVENKGDCDSKSALLAALLAHWEIPWMLVGVSHHMVVGAFIPPEAGDHTIIQDGRPFVILETTRQGWPAGGTGKMSETLIRNGRFDTIRDKGLELADRRLFLSGEIEEAKAANARINRTLIGRPATLTGIILRLDKVTLKEIHAEVDGGRLLSFGVYPDPAKEITTTVQWD